MLPDRIAVKTVEKLVKQLIALEHSLSCMGKRKQTTASDTRYEECAGDLVLSKPQPCYAWGKKKERALWENITGLADIVMQMQSEPA